MRGLLRWVASDLSPGKRSAFPLTFEAQSDRSPEKTYVYVWPY